MCVQLRKNILLIVPVLNGESQIMRTLHSIADLERLEEIHVHVQDGGSFDATVDLCREFFRSLQSSRSSGPSFSLCTEADGGMYDAIHRAVQRFQIHQKNWVSWINAGDTLERTALGVLDAISASVHGCSIDWVSGPINAQLLDVGSYRKPHPIPLELIQAGLADGDTLPFIQQEGTFVRYGLYRRARSEKFVAHRAAGDYFLWLDLSHHASGLAYSMDPMATWHQCEGQLSARLRHVYDAEVERLRPRYVKHWRRELLLSVPQRLNVITECGIESRYFSLERAHGGFCVEETSPPRSLVTA